MVRSEQKNSFKRFFPQLTTAKAISLIVILGFIVYGNALFNGFVWDDFPYIINNPEVHSLNIIQFFSHNLFNSTGYYRPIPALYSALLYTGFGKQAFFYHFLQVGLHILNTSILYLTLRTIISRRSSKDATEVQEKEWNSLSGSQKVKYMRMHGSGVKASPSLEPKINLLSLFLSLIFLVHPINVESVAYIAAANNVLFLLFGLLALLVSVKEDMRLGHMLLVSGLLLLSLLARETGVLFLLMILCFQFLFNRKRPLKLFLYEIATLLIYFFFRFVIGGVFFIKYTFLFLPVPIAYLSFLSRLANIPAIVFYYLSTTFFPLRLAGFQEWIVQKITAQSFYLPLLLDSLFFIALCMGGVYLYNLKKMHFKAYLFFAIWFLSGIGMLLQIFPLDHTVSDRFFYFPLIGLLGMLGVGVQTLLFSPDKHDADLFHNEKAKIATALFGAMLILLFSLRTIVRNSNFHDIKTLDIHDAQVEDNVAMEVEIGVNYASEGNMQAAFPHLQKSVNLYPYEINLFYLGKYYESQGNVQKAQEYYYKALNVAETHFLTFRTLNPNVSILVIYTKLTRLLLLSGDYAAAEKISKEGVHYYPDSGTLWKYLAVSANLVHNQEEALAAAEKAKTLSPSDLIDTVYTLSKGRVEVPTFLIQQIISEEVLGH